MCVRTQCEIRKHVEKWTGKQAESFLVQLQKIREKYKPQSVINEGKSLNIGGRKRKWWCQKDKVKWDRGNEISKGHKTIKWWDFISIQKRKKEEESDTIRISESCSETSQTSNKREKRNTQSKKISYPSDHSVYSTQTAIRTSMHYKSKVLQRTMYVDLDLRISVNTESMSHDEKSIAFFLKKRHTYHLRNNIYTLTRK